MPATEQASPARLGGGGRGAPGERRHAARSHRPRAATARPRATPPSTAVRPRRSVHGGRRVPSRHAPLGRSPIGYRERQMHPSAAHAVTRRARDNFPALPRAAALGLRPRLAMPRRPNAHAHAPRRRRATCVWPAGVALAIGQLSVSYRPVGSSGAAQRPASRSKRAPHATGYRRRLQGSPRVEASKNLRWGALLAHRVGRAAIHRSRPISALRIDGRQVTGGAVTPGNTSSSPVTPARHQGS